MALKARWISCNREYEDCSILSRKTLTEDQTRKDERPGRLQVATLLMPGKI